MSWRERACLCITIDWGLEGLKSAKQRDAVNGILSMESNMYKGKVWFQIWYLGQIRKCTQEGAWQREVEDGTLLENTFTSGEHSDLYLLGHQMPAKSFYR